MAGTVPLAATAAGDDTAIARVMFLVDGSVVGVTTSAPFTFSWNSKTVPDGPHTVRSRAYDTAGNSTVSEPVSITTRNADTTPPSAPSGSDRHRDERHIGRSQVDRGHRQRWRDEVPRVPGRNTGRYVDVDQL